MTLHACAEGHKIYLEWLERQRPERLNLGGEIQQPKIRRGRHPNAPKPNWAGDYKVIHAGTKEWP